MTLKKLDISLGISCDGIPPVQNIHRPFNNNKPSSSAVETGLRKAIDLLPSVMINAVYRPDNIEYLVQSVKYFYDLGLRIIYLTPDYSARWSETDIPLMENTYQQIADLYKAYHNAGDPAYINLVESKIIVLLNDGYSATERCTMGSGEFAFGPEGKIYPCERLAGDCLTNQHCIGHVKTGLNVDSSKCIAKETIRNNDLPCTSCSLQSYCMHWCGCSNYFSSGFYNAPGAFLFASEKSRIALAISTLDRLTHDLGIEFYQHLEKRACPAFV